MGISQSLQDGVLQDLKRNWGWIVARGVVAVLFGVLAFIWPAVTLAVLVLLWGLTHWPTVCWRCSPQSGCAITASRSGRC